MGLAIDCRAPRTFLSLLPKCSDFKYVLPCLGLAWVLGIQAQVSIPAFQPLYPLYRLNCLLALNSLYQSAKACLHEFAFGQGEAWLSSQHSEVEP